MGSVPGQCIDLVIKVLEDGTVGSGDELFALVFIFVSMTDDDDDDDDDDGGGGGGLESTRSPSLAELQSHNVSLQSHMIVS